MALKCQKCDSFPEFKIGRWLIPLVTHWTHPLFAATYALGFSLINLGVSASLLDFSATPSWILIEGLDSLTKIAVSFTPLPLVLCALSATLVFFLGLLYSSKETNNYDFQNPVGYGDTNGGPDMFPTAFRNLWCPRFLLVPCLLIILACFTSSVVVLSSLSPKSALPCASLNKTTCSSNRFFTVQNTNCNYCEFKVTGPKASSCQPISRVSCQIPGLWKIPAISLTVNGTVGILWLILSLTILQEAPPPDDKQNPNQEDLDLSSSSEGFSSSSGLSDSSSDEMPITNNTKNTKKKPFPTKSIQPSKLLEKQLRNFPRDQTHHEISRPEEDAESVSVIIS